MTRAFRSLGPSALASKLDHKPIAIYHHWRLSLQVLNAATVVAKHTSGLCNACRIASGKTNNPVAKRQFVQSAKDVANNTANLVKAIKVRYVTSS